ncbi:uncharacterized protein LOC116417302 [Nasonia vitripennis]|uniref:DUF7041 domain-containing protein n=1 Tax=Nasonia vitripennis TaxID=7425 RepID=A0A7M7T9Y2_NASVI|nr:uncharacterized protein LOC116417302 [Nasonia vitripennis]
MFSEQSLQNGPHANQQQQQQFGAPLEPPDNRYPNFDLRNGQNDKREVDAASKCTLPPYWTFNPSLWFSQAESSFRSNRVTRDVAKYDLIVAGLPQDVAQEVSDVILNPPAEQRYETLKAAVLKRLTVSADHKLHQLLNEVQLGDRTPSQLLRYMRRLGGSTVSDEALRVKWLDLLPSHTSRLCRVLKAPALDELAALADELILPSSQVCATSRPVSPVSSGVSSGNATPQPNQELTSLRLAMAHISTMLQQQSITLQSIATTLAAGQHQQQRQQPIQQQQQQQRGRSATRSSSRQRQTRSTSPAANPAWCWYHQRFASEATQCRPPCSYPMPGN